MAIFTKKTDTRTEPKHSEARLDPVAAMDTEVERTPVSGTMSTHSHYGIVDAIRLMRSLPVDQNIDLVVRVVRVTLSSVNVRIEDIIEDANRRQQAIQDNIAALHEQVANLEEQLEARRRDIAAQEADYRETTAVKERLQQAEKAANGANAGQSAPRANAEVVASPQPPPPPPPPSRSSSMKPAPRE